MRLDFKVPESCTTIVIRFLYVFGCFIFVSHLHINCLVDFVQEKIMRKRLVLIPFDTVNPVRLDPGTH